MGMACELVIKELHCFYGRVEVLSGVSLEVRGGEVVCLLGANGAGKTTLVKAISGLIRAHMGRILFNSREIQNLSPDAIVRLGISQCPEGKRLFPEMGALKNLLLGAYTVQERKQTINECLEQVFELFPVLRARRNQKAGSLSGGEQQMLAIGRAMMAKPILLILDEPSTGLAPLVVKELFNRIAQISQNGTTLLIVEQNAWRTLAIAHRGYVMESGRITIADSSKNLQDNDKVREAYLGI
jgi:branched-chain amino acid transport system ATP-binding protein